MNELTTPKDLEKRLKDNLEYVSLVDANLLKLISYDINMEFYDDSDFYDFIKNVGV